jgi:hypothetical protein
MTPSCVDCCWLPLSSKGDAIQVHCPGCEHPGIIVDGYKLERLNYGLEDGNNDRIADTPLSQIQYGSSYMDSLPQMRTTFSMHGDRLHDVMISHFEPGTSYTYTDMTTGGSTAFLNFLQLKRTIPHAYSSLMNVTVQDIDLYIDVPDSTGGCLDCSLYQVTDTMYRTIQHNYIPFDSLSAYLQVIQQGADNIYFFTFGADSSNFNLTQNIVYQNPDTALQFHGFFERQRYRMITRYSVCGNWESFTSEDWKQSDIQNLFYLSSNEKPWNAPEIKPPNHDSLITFPVDTSWSNPFMFYCEKYGGRHFFVSNNLTNFSNFGSQGCNNSLSVSAKTRIGGDSNRDIFPYEFRIPSYTPVNYRIELPSIMHLNTDTVRIYSAHYNPMLNATADTISIMPADSNHFYYFSDSLHQIIHCFSDSVSTPIGQQFYAFDQYAEIRLEFKVQMDSCISGLVLSTDSIIFIEFNDNRSGCVAYSDTLCSPISIEKVNPPGRHVSQPNPNLDFQFTSLQTLATQNTVCWNFQILNPITTYPFPQNTADQSAYHVYLIPPDSATYPYLTNWSVSLMGGVPIFADSAGVIQVKDTVLSSLNSIAASVCAQFVYCPLPVDTLPLPLTWGWNCDDYFAPDDTLPPCMQQVDSVRFTLATAGLLSPTKLKPDSIYLCDTLYFGTIYSAQDSGYVHPDSLYLFNIPPGMTILSAYLGRDSLGFTSDSIALPLPQQSWAITDSMMTALGFAGNGFSTPFGLHVGYTAITDCIFGDSLPDHLLSYHTFCGLSTSSFVSGPYITVVGSHCDDCFTIEKTALQDTAYVGDTATFQILVCGNNLSSQQVLITEFLPQNFTLTSTIPTFVNVPAQGCDTLLVSGYYSNPGDCNDSANINTAQIITSQYDTLFDSACITVLDSCIAFSSVVIPDSAFATTYGAGFSNTSVYITGVFLIDSTFTLTNCTAYASSSAQIIVFPGQQLILDSASIIMGCSSMWPGITLDTTAKVSLLNQSLVKDANDGIYAGYNSTVEVENSMIYDCVTGIYTPPASGFVNTQVKVRGSKIGMVSPLFKQDYPGQPSHGLMPKAGIEINNLVMTLGGSGQRNEFFKLNTGIVARNSNLIVKNSEFYYVGYDTSYSESYRGTAIVGVVDEGFSGKITVMAEPSAYYAVHNCHRAIYTDRAVLSANYVHLIDVYSGIFGTNTPYQQTSHVTGCTITTQTYGIFWINNRSAKFMIANNNNITVNAAANSAAKGFSKTAIYMSETMHQPVVFMATGNEIALNNAHNGIYSGNQANAKIKFNNIRMNNSSTGIGINNNNRTSVSCNTITGDYGVSSFQSLGILTGNSSDRTALYCNTTDSTYRGFYFGGANPNTVMKGNDMKYHFNGLYLNNIAVIGLQPHHGNRWVGPFDSFGGVNIASQILVQASRFDVDSTLGSVYNPVVSPASGWFQQDTLGSYNTFYCSNSTVCELPPPNLSQTEINELIASGTLLSEEYAEETRAIAQEYLYRELMEDSVLRFSDSLYIEFILENQGEPVAYLYDAEEYLRAATEFDSVFTALIDSANKQIDAINDTLQMIDEGIEFYGSSYDYVALREQLLYIIDFLNQTLSNLYSQAEASLNGNLAEAEIRNDLAVPETVPEENSYVLNDTEIEFLESRGNTDVILSRYIQLLNIAHQCPYTGGPAVERARAFIAMINDSTEYDDDAVCLQVGVYRNETETEVLNASYSGKQVEIIPNPATNQFEIRLKTKHEGICNVTVHDSRKQLIIDHNFTCSSKSSIIESVNLSPGIYFISMIIDDSFIETQKLVIVK